MTYLLHHMYRVPRKRLGATMPTAEAVINEIASADDYLTQLDFRGSSLPEAEMLRVRRSIVSSVIVGINGLQNVDAALATSLIERLQGASFSSEEAAQISDAVHLRLAAGSSAAGGKRQREDTRQRWAENLCARYYFTAEDYEIFKDADTALQIKLQAAIDRLRRGGFRNPMETSVADVLAVVINQHFSLDNIPCAEHLYEHVRSLMTAFANAPAPAGLIFQRIFPSSPVALPPTILEAMYGESKPLLDAPQTGLHMVRLAIPCRSNSKLLKRNQGVLQLGGLNRGAPQLDQIGHIVTQVIGSIFPQRVGRTTPPRGSEERLGGGTRVEEVVENDGAIVVSGRGGRWQQRCSATTRRCHTAGAPKR